MIPEFGHLALILALCFSLAQTFVPMWGVRQQSSVLMHTAVPLTWMVFLLTLLSFIFLEISFLNDDFSLVYAANNSNSLLPWYYKFSAVWGAHEGSMLLWALVLVGWSLAVALCSRNLPREVRAIVLSVQGALAVGFFLFIVLTSNPFDRLLPFPASEGSDLNPLLQDFGLIVHPPLLYMGYVGLSVAFSFAVAALILGRLDVEWAKWLRPWTNVAWAFLTGGIALGSWWAYYELGWGGWWFWDPVENASLMPWLLGTALVHSLAVSEKRNMFKRWTLILALFAFSLSLLGTFLVRSGVLTSVHAFASDPERGVFILIFLCIVIGSSLLLYGLRVKDLEATPGFVPVSRETALLINNVMFVLMCAVVLLGTLYPLVIDMFGLGSVSVGPPYFNLFTALIFVPLLLIMAPGQILRWKRDQLGRIKWISVFAGASALVIALLLGFLLPQEFSLLLAAGAFLALWILMHGVSDLRSQTQKADSFYSGLKRLSLSYWGMQLGHFGVAVCVVGVTFSVALSDSRDVRLAPGDSFDLNGYHFELREYRQVRGPNYMADEGVVEVSRDGRRVVDIFPQKRHYTASGQTMTEAGIRGNLWRDLYVSMGEPLQGGAWAVRLHVKPFIRWIWYGAMLMAFGGLLAVADKRYHRRKATTDSGAIS
jgi:cytochrome c-type biogenesis protein CcmF